MAVLVAQVQGDIRAGFAEVNGALAGMRADAGHLRMAVSDQAVKIVELQAKVSLLEGELGAQRAVRQSDQRRLNVLLAFVGVLPVVVGALAVLLRLWG